MPFWFTFALWAATFAFSQYLAAKEADEGLEDAKARTLDDLNIPTASVARKKPIILGTQKITSPNLIWYGNFRSVPVTEKVETGIFNTKRVITGWDQYLSMQLALCAGPVALRRVWYGTTLVWEGYLDKVGDISLPQGSVTSNGLGSNAIAFREGSGTLRFYPGAATQGVDDYLSAYQDPCPAYRDTAYVIFDGFIGRTSSLQTWAFEVQAIPNGLGLTEEISQVVYDSEAVVDGESSVNPSAIKFVLTEKKRIDFVRFFGRKTGGAGFTWVDGTTKQRTWTKIYEDDGTGKPKAFSEDVYREWASWDDWNAEVTNDWIYLYLHGLELEAGTYYALIYAMFPDISAESEASVAGCTFVWNSSTSQWEDQSVKIRMEAHGWSEAEGTSVLADVNPMNVAYLAFHDYYGYPDADIDLVGFAAAAAVLDTEGNGMGLALTSQTQISELIETVKSQIDGEFYLDPITGKVSVQLVRADYDIEDLEIIDESNIVRVELFDRSDWSDTTNELRAQFTDRSNDYVNSEAMAPDRANQQIRGDKIVPLTMSFPGVCDAALAMKLAWRELRAVSVPLSIGRLVLSKSMWTLHKGQPVVYSPPSGVSLVMRVSSIRPGGAEHGDLEVELVQDVFSGNSLLSPISTGWEPITTDLIPFVQEYIFDAPYALVRRQTTTDHNRVMAVARKTDRGEQGYYLQVDGVAQATCPVTARGLLYAAVGPDDTTLELVTDVSVANFPSLTDAQIGQDLLGLILVDDEMIAVRSAVETPYGATLTVYRGLCDTAQAAHADDAEAWLMVTGAGLSDYGGVDLDTVAVKLIPYSGENAVDAADITATNVTYRNREDCPYPPRNLELNSSEFPAAVDIDTGATLATKGVTAEFLRRDFRILDEVSQLAVDAETVDPTFPAANDTKYCLKVYASDGVTLLTQTGWQTAPSIFVKRTKIVREAEGYMTPLTFAVGTQHTNSGTKEAIQDLAYEVAITSTLSDDVWLGNLDTYQTSLPYTAPETGSYAVTLEAAIDSDVYYKLNGGAWTSCVTAGNTTGTISGVTLGDTIEIRHTDSTTADDELFVTVVAPTSTENAYGVFFFDNAYGAIGGFGSLGFGSGPFGR